MKTLNILFLSTLILFSSGCVLTQSIVTGTPQSPVAAESVRVYSTPPAGAEEVALLNVVAGGAGQYGMDLVVNELKKKAGSLGANGIVILTTAIETRNRGGIGYLAPSGVFISDTSTEKTTKVNAKAIYVR